MDMQAVLKFWRGADMAMRTPEALEVLDRLLRNLFLAALDEIRTGPMAILHPDCFDAVRNTDKLGNVVLITTPVYIVNTDDKGKAPESIVDQIIEGPKDLAQQAADIWREHEHPEVPVFRYPHGYINVIACTIEAHVSCEIAFVDINSLGVISG